MIFRSYYYHYCLLIPDAQAFSNAFYGQGSGLIYLDNVQCSGSELDLFDCPGDNTPSCTQADAAGVRCNPTRMKIIWCSICFIRCMSFLQLFVKRMHFNWSVDWIEMLVVLKCVSWRLGELYVIDRGRLRMLLLFADNLDFQDGVNHA